MSASLVAFGLSAACNSPSSMLLLLSMVGMSLVTLQLSLLLGAGLTSVLLSSGPLCKTQSCPDYQLLSRALAIRSQCQFSPASWQRHMCTGSALNNSLGCHLDQSQHQCCLPDASAERHKGLRAQRSSAVSAQQPVQPAQPRLQDTFQASTGSAALPSLGRVVLQRPLDPVFDLGGQQGRAGLGHSPPVPMQVEQLQPAATGVSVELPIDTTMSIAPDPSPQQSASIPDSLVVSAMLLWAEEYDVTALSARQAVLFLHKHHAQQLQQHDNGSCVSLPEPIQQLMVQAVRTVTKDSSFALHEYPGSQTLAAGLAPGPSASASVSASR